MGRRLQSQPEGLRKFVEGRCPEAQKTKKVTLTRARTSCRQIYVKESYRGLANCGPEIADQVKLNSQYRKCSRLWVHLAEPGAKRLVASAQQKDT